MVTARRSIILGLIVIGFFEGALCEPYSIYGYTSRRDEGKGVYSQALHVENSETCLTKRVHCQSRENFPEIDGSCNNQENPTWGAALTPLRRLLPPEYADSKGEPRAYGKYARLPSPREVSNIMKEDGKLISSDVSHLHVLFGQLLAHDIVHAPIVKNKNGSKLDCNCEKPHRECVNIGMPYDDEQRLKTNKKCITLARSKAATGVGGCEFPHREQLNTMSSVIDGTFLYGKSDQEAEDVRDPESLSGEMKLVENPVGSAHGNLPNQDDLKYTKLAKTIDCLAEVHKPSDVPCFVSGDVRVNENIALSSVQTIWTRYHNWVARGLKSVNPHWNSDRIFNVARRIISALMQSITYREYLPPLLGPAWMKRLGLTLTDKGFWNGYDSRYNPAVINEFTTAAFRYGHSQVTAAMSRPGPFFTVGGTPDVRQEEAFFNSEPLLDRRGGGSGSLMRGFMVDNAEKADESILDAMRNQLFRKIGERFGDDLFSINIQRGRDHGLPPYNKFRVLCGLRRARNFDDLSDTISRRALTKLERAYDHVDDIDLYVGGLAENHVEGGEVGPTYACILAQGFRAIRRGDRYWHEFEHSPSPFTMEQLDAIRQTTYARIFCDAGEDMKYVVKFPMKMHRGKAGTILNCGNVRRLDLTPWRESGYSEFGYTYDSETQWTSWFVTQARDKWSLDVNAEKRRLRTRRPEDICHETLDSETRYVTNDGHLQIRFSCPTGTVRSTDIPFQISQNNRFTSWIEAQEVGASDFSCRNIVALQVMMRNEYKFALETGDVFEKYGINEFSCRDHHQPSGRCRQYKVRALCSRILSTDVRAAQETPPLTRPPYAAPRVPHEVQETVDTYCAYYGLCCDKSSRPYPTYVPSAVTKYAQHLCRQHNICCDTLFAFD